MLTKVWAADPYQISNDEVKDNYLIYIKEKINQGSEVPDEFRPALGKLKSDDVQNADDLCNPCQENVKDKLANDGLDEKIIDKLSEISEKRDHIKEIDLRN